LRTFLDDPERAFSMGRAARDKVVRAYDAAGHLERLTAIYREAGAR
jgi:hypothetical protein